MNAIDRSLVAALDKVARVPNLLVACDYDGTVAPIVDDPAMAVPLPAAITALLELARLPNTTVAIVSSRALRDLATLSRLPSEVNLVGSHGIEYDAAFMQKLDRPLVDLRAQLNAELVRMTESLSGVLLEVKPAGIAVHTRMADDATAAAVTQAVMDGPASWPGISVTVGKKVIDLSVVPPQKGVAVEMLRSRFGANAVLFLGDDKSDEEVFHRLRGPDIGIKVGAGQTQALHRVDNPEQSAAVLRAVSETRRRWILGEQHVRIERHSMLSNGQTVALLTPDARVTWFCHPRPDSPALFADLLGGPAAGHFSIRPQGGERLQDQQYRENSMSVETRWNDLTVTDWLDTHPNGGSGTSLVRWLRGTARTRIEFAPRPQFNQTPVRFEVVENGLLMMAGTEPSVLWSPGVAWQIDNDLAYAEVDLAETGPIVLDLRCGTSDLESSSSTVEDRLAASEKPWRAWASTLRLPATAKAEVLRSALTLRGLWHQPTGAILAAATTSLPEIVGGIRNWDYRYCWLRDATMTARELVNLGSLEEAESLLGWVKGCIDRTGGHPERLHPLYSIDGSDLGPQATIDTLPGYRGSRPVRVGNLAEGQVQLDVFGPVVDLIAAVATARGVVHEHEWEMTRDMVSAVERRWFEPDSGIWEPPIPPRHHVHSKVMCWWTVERALDVARILGRSDAHTEAWEKLRSEIRDDILDRGWNPKMKAFTDAYGVDDPDAAVLWIGLTGLIADDDPKFLSTLAAVERALRDGPTVYRYKWDDGLPGREGGFHICTTWLIESYLRTGRQIEAKALFKQYVEMLGPTGLMPEMYDPQTEEGLGNHPQAYSHLGLIRCALLFDQHQARRAAEVTNEIPIQATATTVPA